MEGNTTPTPQGTNENGARRAAAPASPEIQGGVSFDAPKAPAEIEKEAATPVVSLEEVDRELEKAGVTPQNETPSHHKIEPRATEVAAHHDEAPSWLAEKKAALAAQPPPPAPSPKPAPAPNTTPTKAPLSTTLQQAVTGITQPRVSGATIQDIKKREYSDLIRPLRTYKDDIARAIQKNKLSTSDMSVAEQARKLGRMQEERSQLELKEKIEKDRVRLQALAAVKRRARPQNIPETTPPTAPEVPKPEVSMRELAQSDIPPHVDEHLTVTQGETYEVGELAQQAAAIRGTPVPPLPNAPRPEPKVRPPTPEMQLRGAEADYARRTEILRETRPVAIEGGIPGISRSMKVVVASFALLVVGAGLLAGAFYMNRDNPSVLSPLEIDTLVFAEQGQEIPVQTVRGEAFRGLLRTRAEQAQLPLNAISALTPTITGESGRAEKITTQEFFERAQSGAAPSLVRALHPLFMLGVHSFEGNQPFLVFKTSFYENAFAGMLAWEKMMSRDLTPLFGPVVLGDSGSASSTSTTGGGNVFRDRLVSNIDTRVLVDLNGEVRLMYSFIDRQTLVIATNRDTFLEIVNRLNSTRTRR